MANRVLKFLILSLLSFAFAQAQEAKPLARHPGDVIKYEIKFDGPNADKIKTVNASIGLTTPQAKDQIVGFSTGFGTPRPVAPSSPNTFVVEMTIPSTVATGDYVLANISANVDQGSIDYNNGQDFKVPPIRIENSKTFVSPSVSVKPIP